MNVVNRIARAWNKTEVSLLRQPRRMAAFAVDEQLRDECFARPGSAPGVLPIDLDPAPAGDNPAAADKRAFPFSQITRPQNGLNNHVPKSARPDSCRAAASVTHLVRAVTH